MTLASTFRRPRWGMPMTISPTPSCPPRLMICSSAGTVDFAAVEAEALGAGIFHVEEALEGLGLDQLLQDRLLAFRGEGDLAAFDAVLNPGALLRVGDVHVLDADMAAIGALEDVEHLRSVPNSSPSAPPI